MPDTDAAPPDREPTDGSARPPGLDVVIVNWYGWPALRRCVEQVGLAGAALAERQVTDAPHVIVVDNSLEPPPADLAGWLSARALLVRPGRNLGFGAGCNLGAAQGTAAYLLFLNADAWPHGDALAETVARLASDRAPGIVGGRMVDTAGEPVSACWRFPTAARLTVEALGLDRLRPFRRWGCRMREMDAAQPARVDQVIGAYLALPRALFERLGGFDERFFLYYEEVDLCRRVRGAGRPVAYEPAVVFTHATEPLTPELLAPRLAYAAHSRIVYARKHFGRAGALYVAWLALAVEPWVRLAASFPRHGRSSLRALRTYLRRLFGGLRRSGWSRSLPIEG